MYALEDYTQVKHVMASLAEPWAWDGAGPGAWPARADGQTQPSVPSPR